MNDKGGAKLSKGWVAALAVAALQGLALGRVSRGARQRQGAWLHPTKGWRGNGTRPRGTNQRRIKA